ncbi:unnamed protein product [Phaeothamnion confervicola]
MLASKRRRNEDAEEAKESAMNADPGSDATFPAAYRPAPPLSSPPLHAAKLKKHKNPPVEAPPAYTVSDGWRRVVPYAYEFRTYAKRRWCGRGVGEVFATEFGAYPPAYYDAAICSGRITINGNRVEPLTVIRDSDLLVHRTHRHEPPVLADPVEVVAEDDGVVAVCKPSTIPMHPCGAYHHNTLLRLLACERPGGETLRPAHRLDRLTSGLVLLAKTAAAAAAIGDDIKAGRAAKTYLARVAGDFGAALPPEKERSAVMEAVSGGGGGKGGREHCCEDGGRGGGSSGGGSGDGENAVDGCTSSGGDASGGAGGGSENCIADKNEEAAPQATGNGGIDAAANGGGAARAASAAGGAARACGDDDVDEGGGGVPGQGGVVATWWAFEDDNGSASATNDGCGSSEGGASSNNSDGGASSNNSDGGASSNNSGGGGSNSSGARAVRVCCPIGCVSARDGVYECHPDGKPSETVLRRLWYDAATDTSLVEARPVHGRTHQIRLHLQWVGYPIANDPCYGGRLFFADEAAVVGAAAAEAWLARSAAAGPIGVVAVSGGYAAPDATVAAPAVAGPATAAAAVAEAGLQPAAMAPVAEVSLPVAMGNEKEEMLAQAQRDGESEEDFMRRTCRWCRIGEDEAFNRTQLHSRGIWLHALRYVAPTWGYETKPPAWAELPGGTGAEGGVAATAALAAVAGNGAAKAIDVDGTGGFRTPLDLTGMN